MPSVTIYGASGNVSAQAATKLTISEIGNGASFSTNFPPKEVTFAVDTGSYNEVDRPYKKPLLTRKGITLRKMSMKLFIGSANIEDSVASELAKLEALASSPINLEVKYDSRTFGEWRITKLVYNSVERVENTNEISRADAEIELTQLAPSQVYGDPGGGGGGGGGGGKTYKVKKKDTVRKIVNKEYPDLSKQKKKKIIQKIIKMNDLSGPNKLKPGTKLRLP
jgi:nucleoid-associated protein YgaU